MRSVTIGVAACVMAAAGQACGQGTGRAGDDGIVPAGTAARLSAVVVETLSPGVTVYHASPDARAKAFPSAALIVPRAGTPGGGGRVSPRFVTEKGKTAVRVAVESNVSLYGTGEVAGPLLRNGSTVTLWNHDAYGYDDQTPHLYQSHPWVLGVRPDGTSFGIIFDSTYRQVITMPGTGGGDIICVADGPEFPVVVIERGTPQEVIRALADLIGRMPLPPKWSIGYHQCRYSYYPEARVREVATGFRERKIPCDVIWYDIDYMEGFRVFTFNREHFPDPRRLNADLLAMGFHNVWMINPGVKSREAASPNDPPPEAYAKDSAELKAARDAERAMFRAIRDAGTQGDHYVRRADGSVYEGEVWPGHCFFPDFTRRETREWWATLYKPFMAQGVTGVWNDMNEPAIFNVPSKTMPEDNVHRADAELGGPGDHARFHNIYGMMMIKATREGILAANPDKRPFVLSRANFLGGHRYGATWTGDNTADWRHTEWSISMVLNIGMSGQPNIGPDIGGFAGNGPEEGRGDHFARWMGFGALLPFARGHTGKDNIDKEPWSFGPEVEASCKTALERRYRLMPLYYTLFHEASVTGMPVARPMFFADLTDAALRSEDDGFLLGDGLMVVANMTPDRSRTAVLPRSGWTKFTFEGETVDSHQADLFIRDGAIVPTGPVMQYVDEVKDAPVTLLVSLDASGKASGTLYEDAGDGFGYQRGEFRLTRFDAAVAGGELVITSTVEGEYRPARKETRVRVISGPGGKTDYTVRMVP